MRMRIIGFLETNEMNIITEESEFLFDYFDCTHGRREGGCEGRHNLWENFYR